MKQMVLIVLLALGTAGLDAGQGRGPKFLRNERLLPPPPPAQNTLRLTPAECEAAGIQWAKAEQRECPCVLKAAGKILAPQPRTAIVSYFLPGRISAVHVNVGDRVNKGQPLVTVECAEVAGALSEFFKAVASQELAQLSLAREKQLAADGIGARKNLLTAEMDAKVAQANLEAAEKRLHVLGYSESQVKDIAQSHQISPAMTLHCPIDGKVVTSAAVVGSMVDQSKEILTIVDPTLLWVDAEVYEKDVAKVKIGQEVQVTVPAFPAERFTGKVSYIADTVHPETRAITVRTEMDNRDGRLKPGMFADVSLFYAGNGAVLVVPLAAVLEEGRQKVVFVHSQDGFVRREIQTGAVHGPYQQVLKGLEAGEEVVVEGNHQLKSKLSEAILRGAHMH